jgi:hypothetical protein
MFKFLSRSKRIAVGHIIALAYLLCVLAPGAALAFGSASAPCLDELFAVRVVDAASDAPSHGPHMHAHGSGHDHGSTHLRHDAQAGVAGGHHGHDHHGKDAPGPCCALMCLSAMPAALLSLATPDLPALACAGETDRSLHGEAPALLYRPPIA